MRRASIVHSLVWAACVFSQAGARADFISYINPAKINDKDAVGNQGYTGSIGMDFRTLDPISITQLGAFDNGLNGFAGLTATQAITVAIFDISTKKEISPEITFTKKDPGTLDKDSSSRFKTLNKAIKIDAGVDLAVVAWGFTDKQQNGNFYLKPFDGKGNPPWTTNGNGDTTGWIGYMGTGRYSATAGVFPTNIDPHKPGVPNPYAAGTFKWIEGPFSPEPSSIVMGAIGALGLVLAQGVRKWRRAIA